MITMLIVLIVLLVLFWGGGGIAYRNDNYAYGHGGISLGAIVLIILVILLLTGRL